MEWKQGLGVLAAGALALAPLTVVTPSYAAAAPTVITADPVDPEYTVDPAPTPDPKTQPKRSMSATTSQAGLAIPALSSRPSSTHTIHLDFDGVTIPSSGFGSAWAPDIPAGSYTGFTLDASNDFSQTEVDQITKIWKIVSEKYSPYDVNVTTVDPGTEALRRYNPASPGNPGSDDTYGVKVVITDDTDPLNAICSGNCAGIAYNDLFDGRQQNTSGGGMTAFDSNPYGVAWVFSSKTFGSAQVTALDASHEIGHTMGLEHDGGSANPNYYSGHANWVPIMGITNQNAVSQFSKGEYTGANNTEDDLAIIGTNGNAGTAASFTLADDFTTSGGAPTGPAVLGDQTSYTVNGVITNAADDDVFSISRTCTNALTATATGIGAGQALDTKVEIQNAAGGVLASNDPASGQTWVPASNAYEPSGLNAATSIGSTTAGTTYRIRVDGVGSANPLNTGYSDYGSIGTYTLTISGCTAGGSTVPGPPQSVDAIEGIRDPSAEIDWTAPSSNGGSAITGYQITGLPGGTVELGNVLTYDASNLNPGTTYPIVVKARNANGLSATGATTDVRVQTWEPQTKPGLTAALNQGTANVSWTAPANPGNATLTGWHVVATGTSPTDETLPAGTLSKGYPVAIGTTTYQVTGTYTADLAGAVASDTKSVTRAASAPGAPASAKATSAANGRGGTLTWTAPAFDGGSPVTGYVLVGLPGGNKNLGNVLTYTATGLTPGKTYSVWIGAQNAVGIGDGRTVTLRTNSAPSAPRIGLATSGAKKGVKNATARWAAPTSAGGTAITAYKVVAYKFVKGKVVRSYVSRALKPTVRALVFGLPAGTYKFRVVAYNAVGASTASGYSRLVTSR